MFELPLQKRVLSCPCTTENYIEEVRIEVCRLGCEAHHSALFPGGVLRKFDLRSSTYTEQLYWCTSS